MKKQRIYPDTSVFVGDTFTQRFNELETKEKKEFDAVKFSREQKDRLSALFSKMTKEEILEYLKRKSVERGRTKPCG